jgi:hypothetical protein
VAPAQIFGLYQHDPPLRRETGAKARPSDPPADDKDIRFGHQGGVVTV